MASPEVDWAYKNVTRLAAECNTAFQTRCTNGLGELAYVHASGKGLAWFVGCAINEYEKERKYKEKCNDT